MNKGSLHDIQLDDKNDFARMDTAMTNMGMSNDEKMAIYVVVAGVLHLGNIQFEENEGAKGILLIPIHIFNRCPKVFNPIRLILIFNLI